MIQFRHLRKVFGPKVVLADVGTIDPESIEAYVEAGGNFIDTAVFNKLKLLGIPPSAVCDDSTFIRRVCVDIAGRLPTEPEVKAFLADADPNKRDRLIDQLLDSPEYADLFANKWNMVLRNKRRQADDAGDLTDEVMAEADNENPAEPEEAVEAAVEEAAEASDDANEEKS